MGSDVETLRLVPDGKYIVRMGNAAIPEVMTGEEIFELVRTPAPTNPEPISSGLVGREALGYVVVEWQKDDDEWHGASPMLLTREEAEEWCADCRESEAEKPYGYTYTVEPIGVRKREVLYEAVRLIGEADGREYITRLRKRGWREHDAETAASHYCDGLNAALRIVAALRSPESTHSGPGVPERMFPIQKGTPVPWAQAEIAYVTYRRLFGGSQTLERLAERGGFGENEYRQLRAGKNPIGGEQVWDPDRCPTCYAPSVGPGVPVESETGDDDG
jgi:hypothetical protein